MKRFLLMGLLALGMLTIIFSQNAFAKPKTVIDAQEQQAVIDYINGNPTLIDSVVVYHNGTTIMEEYFAGYSRITPHDTQSATKSITSALIGIAIKNKIIDGVDQPVCQLLPDKYGHLFAGEQGKRLHSPDAAHNDVGASMWVDFGPDSSFTKLFAAADSVAFILGEPLVTTPGTEFYYNSGSSQLLSAIIYYRSGMTTQEFAQKHLFGPLGITATDYRWYGHPDGIAYGGWDLWMKPVDMLEFGKLYLGKGKVFGDKWQGPKDKARVLTPQWVMGSFKPWIYVGSTSYYGYHWWRPTYFSTTADVAHAAGWGGQSILVVDDLDLVIVTTAAVTSDPELLLFILCAERADQGGSGLVGLGMRRGPFPAVRTNCGP